MRRQWTCKKQKENPNVLQHPVNLLCFLASSSHSHILFHSLLGSREALANLIWNQIQRKTVLCAEELQRLCLLYATDLENITATFKKIRCCLAMQGLSCYARQHLPGKDTLLNSTSPLLEKRELIFHPCLWWSHLLSVNHNSSLLEMAGAST